MAPGGPKRDGLVPDKDNLTRDNMTQSSNGSLASDRLAPAAKQTTNGSAARLRPAPGSVNERRLNMVLLYEDATVLEWAKELWRRTAALAGGRKIQSTWWRIGDLAEPGVLAGAVSMALRADVIVVSAMSSDGLPLPFYYWATSWLPHRFHHGGALIAALGQPGVPPSKPSRLKEYLRALAREAKMDFRCEERVQRHALNGASQCRLSFRGSL